MKKWTIFVKIVLFTGIRSFMPGRAHTAAKTSMSLLNFILFVLESDSQRLNFGEQ